MTCRLRRGAAENFGMTIPRRSVDSPDEVIADRFNNDGDGRHRGHLLVEEFGFFTDAATAVNRRPLGGGDAGREHASIGSSA